MVYDYLVTHYKDGEPIFSSDLEIESVSHDNLRQQLKKLVDDGSLKRFEDGIYYFPKESSRGAEGISSIRVAEEKYIERKGKRIGFYSGFTFANQMGISVQVPTTREIVSNNMSAIRREVQLGKQNYIIRKSPTEITEENYKVLQLLDLLKGIDMYSDDLTKAQNKLQTYIKKNKLSRDLVDEYIRLFPLKVYKNIYEMRLDNVFA